jgi:hypothetical protein
MKLMSFQVQTPDGPAERVGALIDGGCLVDLTSACYVLLLTEESCDRRAAARIARALVPPDMVAFIEGGKRTLSMAKEALAHVISREKAFAHFMSRGEAPDGTPVVYPLTAVKPLPAVPRPPLLRDFMAFEEHVKGSAKVIGLERVPEKWYAFPVFYKGNALSLAAHEDDIIWPSYTELLDFELEMAVIIGRRGTDIPEERDGNTYSVLQS